MRAFTLDEVRTLLSGPSASRFFEGWARLAEERSGAEERADDLRAQASLAESRVRLAEEAARLSAARAEEQRRRVLDPALDPSLRPVLRLEAEALAEGHLARAQTCLTEARERRRRATALADEAGQAEAEAARLRERLDDLRAVAGELGGTVGDACLFFREAGEDGGLLLVPLAPGAVALDPFVLHRLAPGRALAEAEALRDAPLLDLPPVQDDTLGEPLEPLAESEFAAVRR